MNGWWIVAGIVVAAIYLWCWACMRVAAKADEDWDRLVEEDRQRRKDDEGA